MNIDKRLENIKRVADSNSLNPVDKIRNIKHHLLIGENRSKEEVLSSVFMVVVGVALIIFMVSMEAVYYQAQEIGDWKMRSILALAAGAMAVGFSGNINIKFHWIQASGSLAVVFLFYFVAPASNQHQVETLQESRTIDGSASVISFLLPPAYAEGAEDFNERIGAGSVAAEENRDSGSDVPVSSLGKPRVRYTYKVVYPIGVGELKGRSFQIGKYIQQEQDPDRVAIYSQGSFLRAPVNTLLYDDKFDIKIKYNRLVNSEQLEDFRASLANKISSEGASISASVGTAGDADIVVELVPK